MAKRNYAWAQDCSISRQEFYAAVMKLEPYFTPIAEWDSFYSAKTADRMIGDFQACFFVFNIVVTLHFIVFVTAKPQIEAAKTGSRTRMVYNVVGVFAACVGVALTVSSISIAQGADYLN